MKIVIATDSFKEALSAKNVGLAIKSGLERYNKDFNIINIPMADGGEGTVQSLVDATGGKIISTKTHDPLMRVTDSHYGILGDGSTAVIEMAATSGLPMLNADERNPLITTTYGVGELILDALDRGCREFVIGLGGSATNDGGVGMLQALGCHFYDRKGKELGVGGKELKFLDKIDISLLDEKLREAKFQIACDVDNTLCGKQGASYVFGPQKGATPEMTNLLEEALLHYGALVQQETGKEVLNIKGGGAAGGLGVAFVAFLDGVLKSGISIVTETTQLESLLIDADLVITGEGKIDFQTAFGKTPYGVARLAKKYGIPVVAIAGSVGEGIESLYSQGFDAIFSIINSPMTLEEAMEGTKDLLELTSQNIIRLFLMNNKKHTR